MDWINYKLRHDGVLISEDGLVYGDGGTPRFDSVSQADTFLHDNDERGTVTGRLPNQMRSARFCDPTTGKSL